MAENDVWSFRPHVGIASGRVIIAYAGTPLKYNCSVFGAPVALASRCAGVKPKTDEPYSTAVVFPATEWSERNIDHVLPTVDSHPQAWELLQPESEPLKNIGDVEVRSIVRRGAWIPSTIAEDQVKRVLVQIKERGRYWPSS